MSSYVLGNSAVSDLEAIWNYIADDSIEAADRWLETRFAAFDALAARPGMGHTRKDLTKLPVRFWPVGAYLIVYRRQEARIEIVAVTQGSRDVPVFLSERGR